jgi:phosphate transport system ATP-binding protein
MSTQAQTATSPQPGAMSTAAQGIGAVAAPTAVKKNAEVKISARGLDFYYGKHHALKNISMEIHRNEITAMIGPSGCGKSTFLRCINRMNELLADTRATGEIVIDGRNIFDRGVDVVELRKSVGMVFQKPNPFPKTIYENVAYGPRIHGVRQRSHLDEIVERSLRGAALWEEVKD